MKNRDHENEQETHCEHTYKHSSPIGSVGLQALYCFSKSNKKSSSALVHCSVSLSILFLSLFFFSLLCFLLPWFFFFSSSLRLAICPSHLFCLRSLHRDPSRNLQVTIFESPLPPIMRVDYPLYHGCGGYGRKLESLITIKEWVWEYADVVVHGDSLCMTLHFSVVYMSFTCGCPSIFMATHVHF